MSQAAPRQRMIESAALLMREAVGRVPARLVQCAANGWRVVIHTTGAKSPSIGEVVALVRCWLARSDLRSAEVHDGVRAFTVRRRTARPSLATPDPCALYVRPRCP